MRKKLLFLMAAVCFFLRLYGAEPLTNDFINNDYTGNWGKLKLVGNQLSSASGEAIQLKGWSTHGYQYGDVVKYTTFNSENGFKGMKSFGANIVRIAAYPDDYPVSYTGGVDEIIEWVKRCMEWTHELNMYCIVDYHLGYTSGDPTKYLKDGGLGCDAEDFFEKICKEVQLKQYKHVLYEICNEPSSKNIDLTVAQTWSKVKEYAEDILPIIDEYDPNAVVIIGTPNFSGNLSVAANGPITYGDLQIMYAFHFYACTHTITQLSNNVSKIPIFASEWGVTDASGGGTSICTVESTTFTNFCLEKKISWCSWSWSAKNERSATLKPAAYSENYNYSESDLTPTGSFVAGKIQESSSSSVSKTKNTQFGIYPNPVKDGFFEVSLESTKEANVEILNMQGQTVFSSRIERNASIDVSQLSAGVYLIFVQTENEIQTQKLIIE